MAEEKSLFVKSAISDALHAKKCGDNKNCKVSGDIFASDSNLVKSINKMIGDAADRARINGRVTVMKHDF